LGDKKGRMETGDKRKTRNELLRSDEGREKKKGAEEYADFCRICRDSPLCLSKVKDKIEK